MPDSSLTASIIIITYNSHKHILGCLDALYQDIDSHSEVIVIDNASIDGSPDLIEEHYHAVQLIRNRRNMGFAAACNQGAEKAQGRYLIFLNPDTVVLRGWFHALLEPLEMSQQIGLTTSRMMLESEPTLINTCGLDIHYTGLSFGRGYGESAEKYKDVEKIAAVSGASFASSSALWKRLGGFDQDYFMYYEDTDLSWRVQLLGYETLAVPRSVALHAHRTTPSILSIYYSSRNRWITMLKVWRIPSLFLLLPAIFLAEIVDFFYLAMIGREAATAKVRAFFWLLLNLSAVVSSRKAVQSARSVSDLEILKMRVHRLNPVDNQGGRLGNLLVSTLNVVFSGYYVFCRAAFRAFGL